MKANDIKIFHINCNYMGTGLHQVMINHLEPYVDENIVFCPIYNGSDIVTKPNDNVIVTNCFSFIDKFFFKKKQNKIIDSIETNIDVKKYNCIHAYTLFTDGNAAYNLSKKCNIPYVVAVRATDIVFFKYRRNLKSLGIKILMNASKVFFLSEVTCERVVNTYIPKSLRGLVKEKSIIVPNGIDDFWLGNIFFEKDVQKTLLRIQQKRIKVICVAQIIKRKNIPILIKAIELLNCRGWNISLQVVGRTVNAKELQKIIKSQNVEYKEPVAKEQLLKLYRASDVFVLPSKGETFGLVYAEAMSQGLPVIYSKNEGFDGQFPEGTLGYHVNPDSVEDIADSIKKVGENYTYLCKNCLEKSVFFRWDDIVKQYSDVYEEITNNI